METLRKQNVDTQGEGDQGAAPFLSAVPQYLQLQDITFPMNPLGQFLNKHLNEGANIYGKP